MGGAAGRILRLGTILALAGRADRSGRLLAVVAVRRSAACTGGAEQLVERGDRWSADTAGGGCAGQRDGRARQGTVNAVLLWRL